MRTMNTTDRYADLARLITARRGELGWNQERAIREAAVSKATWYKALGKPDGSEHPGPVSRASYEKLERGLRWPGGSIEAYLNGGPEPAPAAEPTSPDNAIDVSEIVAAIERSDLQSKAKDHVITQVRLLALLPQPDFVVQRRRRSEDYPRD